VGDHQPFLEERLVLLGSLSERRTADLGTAERVGDARIPHRDGAAEGARRCSEQSPSVPDHLRGEASLWESFHTHHAADDAPVLT